MSIRLMNRVYEKAVDATTQRVLLVLCDYANDHGTCWPSIPLMAWKLGVSERTIMRNIARLEQTGVVAVHRQVGAVNRYEINLEVLPNKTEPPTKRHPRQNVTRDIAVSPPPLTNCPPTRDIAVSPEPPVEPSVEPPVSVGADAPATTATEKEKPTRLSPDFTVTDDMRSWALEEGATDHLIASETAKFRDYWSAVPGYRGRKLNWVATWRNWMRKGIADAPKGSLRPRPMHGAAPIIEIPDHLFGQERLEYARRKQAEMEQERRHA